MQSEHYASLLGEIELNFGIYMVPFPVRWCKPCHTLGEVLEEEVGRRSGQVELARVDVDKMQELAMQYDVSFHVTGFISWTFCH